jgi:hypothetical protein
MVNGAKEGCVAKNLGEQDCCESLVSLLSLDGYSKQFSTELGSVAKKSCTDR